MQKLYLQTPDVLLYLQYAKQLHRERDNESEVT